MSRALLVVMVIDFAALSMGVARISGEFSLGLVDAPTSGTFGPTEVQNTNDDCYSSGSGNNLSCFDSDGHIIGAVPDYSMGVRWTSTGIPQGATVTNSELTCYLDNSSGSSFLARIYGEDDDGSPENFNGTTDIESRTRTTNFEDWSVPFLAADGTKTLNTSDLDGVIQEIVNNANFNGDIVLFVTDLFKKQAIRIVLN